MREQSARVFLINHQPLVRLWLCQLLEKHHGLWVCGTAENVADALHGIAETTPDVAIVDIALIDPGMELIKAIKSVQPGIVVIVLSLNEKNVHLEPSVLTSAHGFVMKLNTANPIIEAIQKGLRIKEALKLSDKADLFHEAAHWTRRSI